MMEAVSALSVIVGVVAACIVLGVSRASYYRQRAPKSPTHTASERKPSSRALPEPERQQVLDTLNSERFVDLAPPQVYATLLDEGTYLCSIRTMYRILSENRMVRERRNQRRHPTYTKPELVATAPNQLWSWDITKLKGPETWTNYYLYVLLDVFSRYVVGWMVAPKESSELGQKLILESIAKQDVDANLLTIHSDRGSPMTAKSMALLLADLGVTKSHSRPRVSNDNPFSESHFKTLKYRPDFPKRFGSLEDARAHCRGFFDWYNDEHYHSSLALFTPADVHYGRVDTRGSVRQAALDAAYASHPERFVHKSPVVNRPPSTVWINPPKANESDTSTADEAIVITPSEPKRTTCEESVVSRSPSAEVQRSAVESASTVGNAIAMPAPPAPSELKPSAHDEEVEYRPLSAALPVPAVESAPTVGNAIASVMPASIAPSELERSAHDVEVEYRPLSAALPVPAVESASNVGNAIAMPASATPSMTLPHGATHIGPRVAKWRPEGSRDAPLLSITDRMDPPGPLHPRQREPELLP